MLIRYSAKNFQCFHDKVEVSLAVNAKVQNLPWATESRSGLRLSTAMGAVGPNGAGKTALLKPAVFVAWFTGWSFQAKADSAIPITPHFAAAKKPTELEFDVEDDQGRLWRYVLHATPERVLHEAMYQKHERYKYLFVRDWDAATQSYDIKLQDFDFSLKEARKVRPNASLISTAAQYGVELAQYLANNHLQSNISSIGRVPFRAESDLVHAAHHFSENLSQRAEMVRLLKSWDLGLSDVELRELSIQEPGQDLKKVWFPYGIHTSRGGKRHELMLHEESSGTQGAFVLLSRLLPTLSNGGLAVIDEFESDLHPHMLEPILDLFANPLTNPHKAQLLFTCHAMEVLNLLHKSQIMLVEKGENCESTAWRMDSVSGIRNDDNFYAKYMSGAYGAVPQL
jgi:uncharacterized protein